jgi:hypothetical protein
MVTPGRYLINIYQLDAEAVTVADKQP